MIKGYQTYLFRYKFQGAEWGFEIVARSEEEAKRRLQSMQYANYDGELYARIPYELGWLAKAAVFLRNLFANKKTA